ncbi:MAG: VanZ family protein [Proteobacteria bacterium]|nr:VanZ family protein [Pseudomonadota bacterium]
MTRSDVVAQRQPLRLALAWGPALLYTVAIWIASSLPHLQVPLDRVPWRDKGVHFVEYAVLGALVVRGALRTWPLVSRVRLLLLSWTATAIWGLIDEIHQAFVPGRLADVADVVADVLGGVAGVAVAGLLSWLAARRSPRTHEA